MIFVAKNNSIKSGIINIITYKNVIKIALGMVILNIYLYKNIVIKNTSKVFIGLGKFRYNIAYIKDTNISTNDKTSNNTSNVGDNSNSNTQVVSVPNTATNSYFGIIGLIVLGMIFTYIKRISNK